ncbi:hypothetical protein B0H65DRAFT_439787 [Neurospora tetraspora]|uniref:Uncharacterized protein n=1 Tax=Neurospora tetraspora TaxID=94610 RepID=A0AAE0JJI2_9PEZI|nr:hypothetical protein B0H65DRAFT_447118 [Neurospora tetraspora]KAK3350804.1 hypothetical protein B0H65DRAFT_439787 [Neurospora tetraspora]
MTLWSLPDGHGLWPFLRWDLSRREKSVTRHQMSKSKSWPPCCVDDRPGTKTETPDFVPSHASLASLNQPPTHTFLVVVPTLAVFEPPSVAQNKTTTPTPWFFQVSSSMSTPGTPAEDSGPSRNSSPVR